ncbi:MAG: type I restriction enzyme HsdR N-terminal domain-containing protein [Crocinitomicaceae bacterium]
MQLIPLNLPMAPLDLKRMNGTVYVECLIRRKKLVLTPEEWVRQHVIHFLIENGVPKGLIASEVSLKYHERTKRADIVVYGMDQKPVWIVECKSADVPLSEAVFRQIASYNHTLQVEYLMMTNGLEHIYAHIDRESGKLTFLEAFPEVNY